ncbi:O-antigen ligase family protein [Colwellia sp. RE-S-Sl-9]
MMGYFILALTIVIYLIRPAEWISVLHFNWNMLLTAFGIIIIFWSFLNKSYQDKYDRSTQFLILFVCSMLLSNIFNGQFSTIGNYLSQMIFILVVYSLVQLCINTRSQVDNFILLIVLLILFICYQCYLQVTVGMSWGGLEPLSRGLVSSIDSETGISTQRELQVIWYGILQDPNDLGMLLIAFSPYIFNRIFYQKLSFIKKMFWFITLLITCYTIILTNSRGSMLSLIGGLGFFYILKKRSMTGYILAGVVTIALLSLAPSRMGELGSGDHSAMGRVYAWILALELLAMNPLFGIGATHFLDYHSLTTHNSYVLAMVENGIVGFFGYCSLISIAVYTMIKVAYSLEDKQRSTEVISLVSGMIGILISIFFISRTYALLPYLYIAIMMVYIRVYCPELHSKHIKSLSFLKLGIISFGFIIFVYIFNRLATSILS